MKDKYYKNMTFCVFEECTLYQDCGRRLTEKDKKDAIEWFGSDEAIIQIYLDKPYCFEGEGDGD